MKITLTFFFLWITTQFGIAIENILAYVFVLSLGVLHGSNDLKLIETLNFKKMYSFRSKLFVYVFLVIVSFCLFLIFPSLGLFLFIVLSGYHFGEQHLAKKINLKHWIKYFVYSVYGLLIFFLIFYTHNEEVINIIKDITNYNTSETLFSYLTFISLGLFFLICLLLFRANLIWLTIIEEFAYLFLFYVLFINSTLLWSFAIYFIVWHALPSLNDQINSIYGEINLKNILKYLKVSFLYWGLSVIGIYLLSYFTTDEPELFNLLFVALLAAITFPHAIVIGKMYR